MSRTKHNPLILSYRVLGVKAEKSSLNSILNVSLPNFSICFDLTNFFILSIFIFDVVTLHVATLIFILLFYFCFKGFLHSQTKFEIVTLTSLSLLQDKFGVVTLTSLRSKESLELLL